MNRRATLATIIGKQSAPETKSNNGTPVNKSLDAAPTMLSLGLDPYTGTFDFAKAAHLLRRVTFGPTKEQIDQAVTDGLNVTLQKIFSDLSTTKKPLNHRYADDPNCPIGETWVDAPYVLDDEVREYRREAIYGWTIELLLEDSISIREKMTLFWHNHFVTSDIEDPRFVYNYSNRLRENALGNFSDFVKEMIIDPSMLRYLNGNQNIASSPNENFARELLELFTVGKGNLVAPGDYTHYTEDDIQAVAKSLTGWRDEGYFAWDDTEIGSKFDDINHDTSTKTLSNRFGNAQIVNGGMNEYSNLVDIILQQDEVARFIVRKIYRWFIYYDITEDIEETIIEPLAEVFRDGNYEIQPVMEMLLRSEHLFSDDAIGCMIKNPMDFTVSMVRQFKMEMPSTLEKRYRTQISIAQYAGLLQMGYYVPPNVAGWKPYYQEPSFHQIWLNSVTLPQRMSYSWVAANIGFDIDDELLIIDPLAFLAELNNPEDVNLMIVEVTSLLLPQPLTETQKIYLKSILIPGLPDFEWNVEYSDYAIDPTNENLAQGIRSRMRNLLTGIVTFAEYQLM